MTADPLAERVPDVRLAAMRGVADDLLLAGLGAGDPETAQAFVRRFQRTVFGVARAIAGPDLAEDIAQQAFERAWRQAGCYDPRRGTVRGWLVRIVHNIAVDTLRMSRSTPFDPDDLAPLIAALTETPEDSALAGETSAELRRALAGLPEPQARAAVMAAVHGLTAQQIADVEDIALGTAKGRIRAAMMKLHAALPAPRGTDE